LSEHNPNKLKAFLQRLSAFLKFPLKINPK
jgi:hypothetical protein